jgi:hypothetical protein
MVVIGIDGIGETFLGDASSILVETDAPWRNVARGFASVACPWW